MYQDQTAANVKLRSAVVDYKKKSKQRKRLWRRGFSEFYDITDMKPRHVLTFNIIFILKRLILAFLLVLYRPMKGSVQVYVIAVIHLVFCFHYFVCWWYMSLFKKFLHILTDVIVFVVLLFPVY